MPEPQLTMAWWEKNKAKTMPPSNVGKLLGVYEMTLKNYEKSVAQPRSKDEAASYAKVTDALKAARAEMAKAKSKCNKVTHKETIANLEKLDKVLGAKDADRLQKLHDQWRKNRLALANKDDVVPRDQAVDGVKKGMAALEADMTKQLKQWQDLLKLQQRVLGGLAEGDPVTVRRDFDTLTKGWQDLEKALVEHQKACAGLAKAHVIRPPDTSGVESEKALLQKLHVQGDMYKSALGDAKKSAAQAASLVTEVKKKLLEAQNAMRQFA